MRLLKESDWQVTPWRSGHGETAEISAFPANTDFNSGNFVWRLSVAKMAEDADFSAFPGFERILTVIEGAGLELDARPEGPCETVLPMTPVAFPGERGLRGRLTNGPVRNLNLMCARGRAGGEVRLRDLAAGITALSGKAMGLAMLLVSGPQIRVKDRIGGETFDLNRMDVLLQCDEENAGFELEIECRESCGLVFVEVSAPIRSNALET